MNQPTTLFQTDSQQEKPFYIDSERDVSLCLDHSLAGELAASQGVYANYLVSLACHLLSPGSAILSLYSSRGKSWIRSPSAHLSDFL